MRVTMYHYYKEDGIKDVQVDVYENVRFMYTESQYDEYNGYWLHLIMGPKNKDVLHIEFDPLTDEITVQ